MTSVGRGAAVSEFVNGDVLLCGGKLKSCCIKFLWQNVNFSDQFLLLGRDTNNRVLNSCMGYQMDSDTWKSHSQLIDFREEAASVVVAGQVKQYFLDLLPKIFILVIIKLLFLKLPFRCTYLVDSLMEK